VHTDPPRTDDADVHQKSSAMPISDPGRAA
jgi:hypothetical protein